MLRAGMDILRPPLSRTRTAARSRRVRSYGGRVQTIVKRNVESYSYRACRCGQAMQPAEQSDRRWICTICGRTAR